MVSILSGKQRLPYDPTGTRTSRPAAFLQQMTQAQPGQKDAEADALIREASVRQPDAAYLLVQLAMGLGYALQAAQAQAAKLQAELDQLRPSARSSFLDNSNVWGRQIPARMF